jgi:hypothetical protein
MISRLGLSNVGISPCPPGEAKDQSGNVLFELPPDECYKMLPQRLWTGLWRDEFEGSRFCPDPAETCDAKTPGDEIWLVAKSFARTDPNDNFRRVRFLGRRTAVRGRYGHFGEFDYLLVVDRFIVSEKLDAGSPPDST